MSDRMDPNELLKLGRAGLGPSPEDRTRVELALTDRLEHLPPLGPGGGGGGAVPTGLSTGAKAASVVGLWAAAAAVWLWVGQPSAGPETKATASIETTTPTAIEGLTTPKASTADDGALAPAVAQPQVHADARGAQAPAPPVVAVAAAPLIPTRGRGTRAAESGLPVASNAHAHGEQRRAQPRPAVRDRSRQEPAQARPNAGSAASLDGSPSPPSGNPQPIERTEPAVRETDLARTVTPADPFPRADDHLSAELLLIDRASRALSASQPGRALELLARHATLYGRGALQAERDGLTAIARCALGERERARELAERFLARNPSSPLSARVRKAASCAAR